ncbi:MAG: phage portal protein [Candidatus Limivicinus sp.]
MRLEIDAHSVPGLAEQEKDALSKLIKTYTEHQGKNLEKERYYEGKIPLSSVNLGIALPDGLKRLEIGCAWGAKTVDVLASLSMFDGFVGTNGDSVAALDEITSANRLIDEYMKATVDELKFGCSFATLSGDQTNGCKIRFHSPLSAAALWSGEKGRIDCGLAIIDTAPDNSTDLTWSPSIVNMYTDDAVIVLRRSGARWTAERHTHKMGRPLMEPLIWNATTKKPFGRSRIKWPIRRLIDSFVRTVANATIGLEFATSPQKYIMGVTDEQFDAVVSDKFRQYVGSIIASTTNPETGENPDFGQLAQGGITPHVDMLRILSTQFSAATGLTVTDTGVVNDANPTSSDAILAQSRTLIRLAEDLNTGNGAALRTIARMALAIANNQTLEDLDPAQADVIAHFKNPSMPSVAVTADAAVKIAGVRPGFSQTDTFLEMLGFSQAEIRRIKAQEQRARGLALFEDIGQ